ncbi:ADP-ribosylglycohydrolase family protein [Streptomyces sp. LB8]|uniref:ADP-ribosylglycohydrolase family protein n=1 Tax=Streptomyces sp. LB8 TaxID=3042509 RepID=UPI0026498BB8|nr:ADP-ribosylglycohydrolase family protein [Streptomyces sp. LB8]MDN5385071.1 ADP-ribosylglycohydrolase family protein [Streptomyces sp. LB8]
MVHARKPQPHLDVLGIDRAAGVLLGAAVGDALGVPYEFAARLREDQQPQMIGGGLGPYKPGEYSDDTQMQVCIAEVAATGADLRAPEALDAIAANFQRWLREGASDVGNQTKAVLNAADRASGAAGAAMLEAARSFTAAKANSAGNGSLMRTGIVALAYLGDVAAMAEAAVAVSALTHPDPDCTDACVLWCSGIRTAVLEGTFDGVRAGLDLLPAERRVLWAERLDEAEAHPPHHFSRNGWVVHALQAAWSAIVRTPVPELSPAKGSFPAQHLRLALEAAVRAGTDTDTVAAIAGALLGARWGCSGIPLQWQQAVHGWPGLTGADLVRLAVLTARNGSDDAAGWPSAKHMPIPSHSSRAFAIPHPHDPGVVLGNLALLQSGEPVDVDAVVSLCRMGTGPVLPGADVEHVRIWLVDSDGDNANLHYVVDQAAREVLRLRRDGKRVLLHCAAGQSRTPAIAAVYSHLATGIDAETALSDLRGVLVHGWHLPAHTELLDAVHALAAGRSALPVSRSRENDEVRLERAPEPDRRTEFLKEKWAASRVRGLLLGLAVGDTLGAARGKLPAEGSLRAGVSTQLACFTVEGTIRAYVRGDHRGLCHPPSVVWHAYCRWAALQGIEVERMRRRWITAGDERWPDGWLAQVPMLAQRRGSAPATVAALSKIEQGTTEKPTTTSRGCHALTRTLPVAVAVAGRDPGYWVRQVREIAALTHGDPAAQSAAAHATVLLSHCLTSTPEAQDARFAVRSQVRQALVNAVHALPDLDLDLSSREHVQLLKALEQADRHPADPKRLAHLAPDATAPSALLGGLYVAASFPERDQVDAALRFAAGAPDGDSVACMTGALLGAAHGVEALPIDLVSRHELAWVLDTLARDLVAQIVDRPSGGEYLGGWDPHWWDRYPGW